MTRRNRSSRQRRAPEAPAAEPRPPGLTPRSSPLFGFNPDYTHVRRDLQRIALLAVLLIGGMLAAWAFLR